MSNGRTSPSPISIPSPSSSASRRRSSLSPRRPSLADTLARSPIHPHQPSVPSSMATAAANAQSTQGRRLSLSTLGLSGSPAQISSPSGPRFFRAASIASSTGSTSGNPEEAVIDEDIENFPSVDRSHSPSMERLSSEVQTARDARELSPGSAPLAERRRTSLSTSTFPLNISSGPAASNISKAFPQNDMSNLTRRQLGDRFNWPEALRSRAERAPSLSGGPPPVNLQAAGAGQNNSRQRAASLASIEQPVEDTPKHPNKQKEPDFFQEKILRGDYFD